MVDEIIIVDTGSTDNTKNICQSFHAQVFDYPWTDNFSDARNYCINKASCDWILWMDADEQLIILDIENIKKILSQINSDLCHIQMRHLIDTTDTNCDEGMHYYISYHHRLFRNNCGFYFRGSIHETLVNPTTTTFDNITIIESMIILHYGYLHEKSTEKSLRNLILLIREKENQADNPWLHYHIATELYRLNDLDRAFIMVNHSIAGFIVQSLLPPALAYKLKYEIITNYMGQDHVLEGIEKTIELYPDYIELYFYKGINLFQRKKYNEAIKAFNQCIILGEYNPKYLILSGNGSFRAYHYIGSCHEKLDQIECAKEAYRQSLFSNPRFQPSIEGLEKLDSPTTHIE